MYDVSNIYVYCLLENGYYDYLIKEKARGGAFFNNIQYNIGNHFFVGIKTGKTNSAGKKKKKKTGKRKLKALRVWAVDVV